MHDHWSAIVPKICCFVLLSSFSVSSNRSFKWVPVWLAVVSTNVSGFTV